MDSTKIAPGHIRATLSICILVHLGREMSMHYFSSLGWVGVVYIKSGLGHVMLNMCLCIRWDLWVT
jgi:hypothetical protein